MKKYIYNGRTVPGMYQGDLPKAQFGPPKKEHIIKPKPYDREAHKKREKENFEHSKKKLKELGHILTFGLFRKTGGSTGNGPNRIL